MKRIFLLTIFFAFNLFFSQKLNNIQSGESISYRIHYGFITAGSAKLSSNYTTYNGIPHLYAKGVGQSSGIVSTFFKVNDLYESFINIETGLPSYYVRNVSEGNYKQHLQTTFNHQNHTLKLIDIKNSKKEPKNIKFPNGVQDMLSAFYYLRSLNNNQLKIGDIINLNVWIDDEIFPFQLKIIGTENIKTKFGKINCLIIKPFVISGRVFKNKEGVTLWVSNDQNHLPIAIKAELAVGSLRADISNFSNIKYPLNFKK